MKREEQKIEFTWKLEDMFPDNEAWNKLFKDTGDELKDYAGFAGTLGESADRLLECIRFDEASEKKVEKLYVYAKMRLDENTADPFYQEMFAKAQSVMYEAAGESAFIIPEILSIPEDKLKEFMASDNGIDEYRTMLNRLIARKAHTRSAEIEGILADSMEACEGASDIFNMFNNADVRFPEITGEDGEKLQITHGNFISLMKSPDRQVRKAAFEGLYSEYKKFSNTLAAAMGSNLKQAYFYAKTRNYTSSRDYYLSGNEIPEAVYDNLIAAVRENLPKLHRYTALRKKLLGLEELHMYDIYVPLVKDADKKYSYEEAVRLVLEGLAPMGEEYINLLKEGFENRWVDVYENEGKRSGAYSWGVYDTHPYVLLNFDGTLGDVFTIAHEMGHSLHTWYSNHNRSYVDSQYKIFVAEVASTCNEALLIRYLLQKVTDLKERAYLLNYFLEAFRTTLYRQTMFAEFEYQMHMRNQKGEAITSSALCGMYHELNKDYYGDDCVIDAEIDYEWERIPHFYSPFYVYQYSTGFAAALAISARIITGDEEALAGYKKFLSGGCSDTPVELLKLAGVDMSTAEPVNSALAFFEELLDEFEKTMESLG